MSVFSVNQATHLYVVPTTSDYSVAKTAEGDLFFTVKNADGETLRSDILTNISYIKATDAADMRRKKNAVKITFTGNPEAGKQYILGITYTQWMSDSDEITYHEMADIVAPSTTASDFYKAMALALAKNTAKQGLVEIRLYNGTVETTVSSVTLASSLTGTYTELRIIEKEQPWKLGIIPQTEVFLEPGNIQCKWGTVAKLSVGNTDTITNGKTVADMEYFCLGFRGDRYRNLGWPNSIPTKGLADPTVEYDMLNIHYSYIGSGLNVEKSEKDIVIACPATSHTVINSIISAINTLNGVESGDPGFIATLS